MNRHAVWLLLLLPLLLVGCSGISDTRPEIVRTSERMLERGVDAHNYGDYATAIDLFSRALGQYRSIDDRQGMLYSHLNLAETSLSGSHHEPAAQHIAAATRLAKERDHLQAQQRTTLLQARWYWQQQQGEQALEQLSHILPDFEGSRPLTRPNEVQLAALALRSEIALHQEQEEQATRWIARLRQSITRGRPDTPWHLLRLQRLEAQLAAEQGAYQQALALLEEPLARYREAAMRPAIAATLREAAEIEQRRGEPAQAIALLERALHIRVWMMDRAHARQLLRQLAQLHEQQGEETLAAEKRALADGITGENNGQWRQLQQSVKPR